MTNRILTLILAFSFSVLTAVAQLQFKGLPLTGRLSSNMINSVFQDKAGFIYFGTATGLNRFDGYSVQTFHNKRHGAVLTSDNFIEDIQQSSNREMWIKTGKGYVIFNPATEQFEDNVKQRMTDIGVPDKPNIARIEDDYEWFYVKNKGIYRRKAGEDKAVKVEDRTGCFRKEDVMDIKKINAAQMAVVDSHGDLMLIDTEANKVVRKLVNPLNPSRIFSIYQIFVDKNRDLWVYGETGVWIYNFNSGGWSANYQGVSLKMPLIKTIINDRNDNVWIGFDHAGIWKITPKGEIHKALNVQGNDQSLSNNSVTALLEDRAGTLWVGTRKSGVSMYNHQTAKFDFNAFPDVNAILCRQNGEIWLGTDCDGVIRWNPSTGSREPMKAMFTSGHNVYAVVCMAEGRGGSVWVGTYNGGLFRIGGGKTESFTIADGLVSNHIWSIMETSDGNLLLATLGGGLQLFNPATKESEVFRTENSGLGSDYVTSLSKGGKGIIYAATSWGLSVFDTKTKKVTNMTGNKRGDQLFSNPNINQVLVDSRGLVWLATYSGMNIYDRRNDKVYIVETGSQKTPEFILGVAEDSSGQMWASVGSRIINIKVKSHGKKGYSFETLTFDNRYGQHGSDFNQRSFCLLPSGKMLVGGLHGVTGINPADIYFDKKTPQLFFTGLTIRNNVIVPMKEYDGRVILDKALNCLGELNLSSDEDDFSVSFATEDYYNADKIRYRYRLVGFNDEWVELPEGGLPQVSYASLPSGSYELQVKAIGPNGVVPEEYKALKINVANPFYLSAWAWAVYLVLIAMVVYGVISVVKRHEQQKFREREREEAARKQEEINQMKFRFFTNISHELRTPLTLIFAPVEALLTREHDETSLRQLNIIQANATRLLNLVNQILDFRKSEMSGLKLNATSGDVIGFVKSISDSFLMFSEKKDVEFAFHASQDRLQMDYDEDKMGKIVMNLLSNAFKFTPANGKVSLSIDVEEGNMVMKVADTGVGISDEAKLHVFDRFYQASESMNSHLAGTGIGLSLVSEYAKIHNGTVTVTDNAGGGTVFTVVIPIVCNAQPAAEPVVQEPLPCQEEEAVAEPQKETILLVDDNHDILDFISAELSGTYHIVTAHDGIEALKQVARHRPDLIVSDIMMPEMDGIELCRKLKGDEATASIPVFLLTAKHDVAAKIEGLTLGADEYMTKPFNMDVLKLRIKNILALRKKGARRALIDPEPEPLAITSLDEQLIEKAVKYVEENMKRSNLSVEELAAHLGMSRTHLFKRLKQLTGKPPIEFIRILRLKRAAQYLRESQLNVQQISYKCGFSTPKHFAKYFKEEFGVAPSVYQENEGA